MYCSEQSAESYSCKKQFLHMRRFIPNLHRREGIVFYFAFIFTYFASSFEYIILWLL